MLIQRRGEAWGESSGECLERREQTRYGLRAIVDFEWRDAEGVSHRGQGLTRDISIKGMFIRSDSQPPAKTDLHLELSFRSVAGAFTNLRMNAEALVIRVEPASSPGMDLGFAVLNRSCKLHNGGSMEA
jgi:hypothetical protein